MSTTVGTKGQVTIEKQIRDALGLKPGWRAYQHLEKDRVVLTFRPPKHTESILGILAPLTNVRIPDEESMHEAIERAWEEQVRDWEAFPLGTGESE